MIKQVVSYPIPGLKMLIVKSFPDERGVFESMTFKELEEATGAKFIQINRVYSNGEVLRGMHYQLEHPQGKLVCVESGLIIDTVVDLRKNSPTFGHSLSFALGQRTGMLYVPPGLAHGYYVKRDYARVTYMVTEGYYPEDEHVLLWSDPVMNRCWPERIEPRLSKKDAMGKEFADCEIYENL